MLRYDKQGNPMGSTARTEPRVVDTALGAALGYERPRAIRQLIERFPSQLRELGVLPQRVANTPDPEGRGRPSYESLLNLNQINYLITRCAYREPTSGVSNQPVVR
jgi:hypothetical protein